jgi:hypothetical protein
MYDCIEHKLSTRTPSLYSTRKRNEYRFSGRQTYREQHHQLLQHSVLPRTQQYDLLAIHLLLNEYCNLHQTPSLAPTPIQVNSSTCQKFYDEHPNVNLIAVLSFYAISLFSQSH